MELVGCEDVETRSLPSFSSWIVHIYAGTVKANGEEWKDKSDCTDETIETVRDYIIQECLGGLDCSKDTSGGYKWKLKDGRIVKLIITIEDGNDE